ncbi:MAG TPA: D-alanyl-D-alanine carboxypeptidase/D-alanyl-D-alanine-endopeptidase [Acidimicrobiales bacterium]|nr:D-alanyl-D-alanine carboxypeptidase/D-alanyl-D-alanine-endopeptidase [Acidimicrobiales bacterium]
MRTFLRAAVRVLPGALVAVVGLIALTNVVGHAEEPAAAASGLPTHLSTPVLSARRVVDELVEPVGEQRLAGKLQPFAASLGASSCLSVTIDGKEIVDTHGDTPLLPASTLKLLTGSAALDVLGADHVYTTSVRATAAPVGGVVNGDVWLVGGGDPLLATQDYVHTFRRPPDPVTPLESLADKIVAAGVTQITGRVVGDESRYDAVRYVPSWPQRYINAPEIGPMSALTVNDGFMSNNSFRAAANPAESGAQTLVDLLAARGVTVGGVGSGVAPDGTVEIASIQGAPLPSVVGEDLRISDNGTAELLLKEIGHATSGTGSTAAGAAAVVSHLRDAGLPVDGLVMNDGSGLDRGDRATCNLLTSVLDRAGPQSDLTNDLSIAGETGTLDRRLANTVVAGKVRAKTGTLTGVAGLAGFAQGADGTEVTFALLLNGDQSNSAFAMWMQLLTTLIGYPDVSGLSGLGPLPATAR